MKELGLLKVKTVIKDLLKKKNITYEEVAEHLGCSLPTVNRILGPEELSLSRLLEICELLQISFSELGNLVGDDSASEDKFSVEQESFLAKNPHFFAYFMKLQSGESPKEIADNFKLTQRSQDKYLIGLENQGLIKVLSKNRVRTVFKNTPHLGTGPLGKLYFEKLIETSSRFFIDQAKVSMGLSGKGLEKTKFSLTGTVMTPATYLKYVEEMEQLNNYYRRVSGIEEKVKKSSELMTAVFVRAHVLVDSKSDQLKKIENIFGDIKNF